MLSRDLFTILVQFSSVLLNLTTYPASGRKELLLPLNYIFKKFKEDSEILKKQKWLLELNLISKKTEKVKSMLLRGFVKLLQTIVGWLRINLKLPM